VLLSSHIAYLQDLSLFSTTTAVAIVNIIPLGTPSATIRNGDATALTLVFLPRLRLLLLLPIMLLSAVLNTRRAA
jgi:hypothetical protein